MSAYIYFCPTCHSLTAREQDSPTNNQSCNKCKTAIDYIGYTKEEYDLKTSEDKKSILVEWNRNVSIVSKLNHIDKNINIIKTIIVALVILWIIDVVYRAFLINLI